MTVFLNDGMTTEIPKHFVSWVSLRSVDYWPLANISTRHLEAS